VPRRRASVGADAPLVFGSADGEQAFVRVVVENVAQPIFVKDRAHRWVWVNDAFLDLIGFSREETLGRTDHDLFPKPQADYFHLRDDEVFRTRSVVTIEEEPITRKSGEVHTLTTTKAPVLDASGAVTHLVGIIHDITRRKQVEEALRLANQELEQRVLERTHDLRQAQNALLRRERLVVLGQLAGGLAHQIRHPLSVISNAAAVVRQRVDVSKDESLRQALFSMAEEVREADRIISDLIDFARVREATFLEVPVAELLDSVLSNVHVPAHITVERARSAPALLRVDPRQTRDAIGNLLRNAIEAIESAHERPGDPRAGVRPPRHGTVRFEIDHGAADFVVLRVIDDGPGVAPGMIAHLFEPLVTDKTLGLGLGLCTARALIENQGGTLAYEGVERGACFKVHLPTAGREGRRDP
jgi:PAS domain S-box-containing protein